MNGYEGIWHSDVIVNPRAYPVGDGSKLVLNDSAYTSDQEVRVDTTAEGRYIALTGVARWYFTKEHYDYKQALKYQKCKKNADEPQKFRCYIYSAYRLDSAPERAGIDLFVNIPPDDCIYPDELHNEYFFDIGSRFSTVEDFVNHATLETIRYMQDNFHRHIWYGKYIQGTVGSDRIFLATYFHNMDADEERKLDEELEELPFY